MSISRLFQYAGQLASGVALKLFTGETLDNYGTNRRKSFFKARMNTANTGPGDVAFVVKNDVTVAASQGIFGVSQNDDSVVFFVDGSGRVQWGNFGDYSATIGAVTTATPQAFVTLASGASSVVVTNADVSATSFVQAWCIDNAHTTYVINTVATAGSFTINLNGAAGANRKIAYIVWNR